MAAASGGYTLVTHIDQTEVATMAGKLTFLVGLGAGYVLGTRSGRQKYDQMVGKAKRMWKDPRVQDATEKVQHMAEERMPGSSHSGSDDSGSSGSDNSGSSGTDFRATGTGTGSRTSPVTGSAPGQGAGGTGQ